MRAVFIFFNRHRLSPRLAINFWVMMYCLSFCTWEVNALTPQEIFRKVEPQVVILESLDKKGDIQVSFTALILDKGKVVTSCDAIEGASSLRLRQGDKIFPAKPGKKDIPRNICIVDVAGFEPSSIITLRESDPSAGAQVYALSNALGMGISISEGVVSGIRTFRGDNFIQFTSAIAPGSQGGGLFDVDGRLVGLINYRQRDGQNINFALPARWLKDIEQRAATIDEAESWRARAQTLEREAKWPELIQLASKWTEALEDTIEGRLYLGHACEEIKDWPSMEKAFREILKIEPSAVLGGIGLAKALLFQSKYQEALEAARSILTYRQEDASAWVLIASAQLSLNLLDDAKHSADKAIQIEPWNRDIYRLLIAIAQRRGDLSAAIAAQRQVVSIAQQNVTDWIVLSDMYLMAQRPERALSSIERAIEIAPENGDAWLFKGKSLYALKRSLESITALKKGIDLNPTRPALGWGWLGDVYMDLFLFQEAIDAYRKATALDPNDAPLKGRLGIALKDGLYLKEALGIFEKLRDDHPDDPFPWCQIGFIYSGLAQAEKAIPAYEKALSLDVKEPRVWMALMEAYHSAGRQEDVKRAYPKLMAIDRSLGDQAYKLLLQPYEEIRK